MSKLTKQEKEFLINLIEDNKPIPSNYKRKLFASDDSEFIEVTKDYKLVYQGKEQKQNIIANTPVAPFQEVRRFNSDNPSPDGWKNMLIFGDNLLALKTIYDDQRDKNIYGTKNKIKLIYIDPPFATKQDFMKDKEKAYRDKVIGSQFIEFLRKRLILLREILADDGSIYVHLDWKKGHYIKAIMDEVFGEFNFLNEIIFQSTPGHHLSAGLDNMISNIYYYKKISNPCFNQPYQGLTQQELLQKFPYIEQETGRRFTHEKLEQSSNVYSAGETRIIQGRKVKSDIGWRWTQKTFDKRIKENPYIIFWTENNRPRYKRYLDNYEGRKIGNLWDDLPLIASNSKESTGYPTQKPESLLARIIETSSNSCDIVLDAFAGSGSSIAVSEKLGRRWIGIDCGKLAIYTTQKRMLNLTTQIGAILNDVRPVYERVSDFDEHIKNKSQALFILSEKIKNGDLFVTDSFLKDLAKFIQAYFTTNKEKEFSLILPEDKLKITSLKILENDNDYSAGVYIIKVHGVTFLISFIQPKEKSEKEKSLKAKEFILYNAGIYDNEKIKEMNWQEYKPFVMKLFNVREASQKIHGLDIDGYIGTDLAYVWNYPQQKKLTIDEDYVQSLHNAIRGKGGDKFYIIAPVTAMGFMMDEIKIGTTIYCFLKVPISVIMRLLNSNEAGALRQPINENDVNEVIDAVGFDFISQPIVKAIYKREKPENLDLLNSRKKDFVIKLKEFRSKTLASDPNDFDNFETLSMVLVDTDFNDDVFNFSKVFWAEDLVKEELQRNESQNVKEKYEEKLKLCKNLDIRIPQDEFTTSKMMVIYIDKYGNEKKEVLKKGDFK
jgi:DNA modification methylase